MDFQNSNVYTTQYCDIEGIPIKQIDRILKMNTPRVTRSRLGRMMNSVVKSVITPVQNRIKSFMVGDDLIGKPNRVAKDSVATYEDESPIGPTISSNENNIIFDLHNAKSTEKDNQDLSCVMTTNNEENEIEEIFSDAGEDVYRCEMGEQIASTPDNKESEHRTSTPEQVSSNEINPYKASSKRYKVKSVKRCMRKMHPTMHC